MADETRELDRVIHQAVRTRIIACLAARGDVKPERLRNWLDLTDGEMTTHMPVLIENGYVEVISRRTMTLKKESLYQISSLGRERFIGYVRALGEIIRER